MAPASRLPVGAGSRVGPGHVFRAELECFTPGRRTVRRRLPGDGGPPFGWFPGGELNAAHNCIDHNVPMVPELPGFFTWPRESTPGELAASPDVASPMLYNPLWIAQQKVLTAQLDDQED